MYKFKLCKFNYLKKSTSTSTSTVSNNRDIREMLAAPKKKKTPCVIVVDVDFEISKYF